MKSYRCFSVRGFGILFGILLFGFTSFVLLDTFAIPQIYEQIAPSVTQASADTQTQNALQAATAFTSVDPISITLRTYNIDNARVYVADVTLQDISYLKTAFAQDAYGRNVKETTSSIAQRHGALLAINGDFYGARQKGYVIRGGVLYRNEAAADREDLVIYSDGSFGVIQEGEVTAETLLQDDAIHVFSFGPALIEDGVISVNEEDRVGRTYNPRTAIGIVEPLHYLFLVTDGRTEDSAGLSLTQMAEFMLSLGASTAYNLDGGGSSTLYYQGEVVNTPATNGRSVKEREVSDIVYIGE